jgi:hypothetical protein
MGIHGLEEDTMSDGTKTLTSVLADMRLSQL